MHFLRLIRPVNLIIIAATMYCLGWYFDLINVSVKTSLITSFEFFLLVLSTVIIAAAGNVINDYFDVRADRINRPERMVVARHIKRRWAIVLHWVMNFIAFGIAVYLTYVNETFWYVFIHLLSINLLWFYSMQLKRTVVIGNVVIALLTSLVPVLVGIFYNQHLEGVVSDQPYPFELNNSDFYYIYFGIGIGVFAFVLNWTREVVKDVEDIEGDKVIKAKTIPIVFGVKKARNIALISLVTTVLLSFILVWSYSAGFITDYLSFSPLMVSALIIIVTLFKLAYSKTKKDFAVVNTLLKVTMIIGLLLPLYWSIQLISA